jgi:hypothetical protein
MMEARALLALIGSLGAPLIAGACDKPHPALAQLVATCQLEGDRLYPRDDHRIVLIGDYVHTCMVAKGFTLRRDDKCLVTETWLQPSCYERAKN